MSRGWVTAPVWNDWRTLMRTLYSARIAFNAEINKWNTPYIYLIGDIEIRFSDGDTNYKSDLLEHIQTLSDDSFFYSMILLRAVSLMENHAKLVSHIIKENKFDIFERDITDNEYDEIDKIHLRGDAGTWGTQLLSATNQDWGKVYKGKDGIQEVMYIRNAIAHGYNNVTSSLYTKLQSVNCAHFSKNSKLTINHQILREYTGRIKSLMRILCDGVYHTKSP
jgi:hypothetical protein